MGTTTKMAIPYPESTGLVKDGWEDMKDIATQVDAKSGLVLIKSQTIGSTVSSVTVSAAFSSSFDNYLITITGGIASANQLTTYLQLGASTANYYNRVIYATWAGSPAAVGSNNGAYWSYIAGANSDTLAAEIYLSNPFNTKYTSIRAAFLQDDAAGFVGGVHKVAASYDAFIFGVLTGSMTGGTIRVYGVNQ